MSLNCCARSSEDAGKAFAGLGMTGMGEALRVEELEIFRSAGRALVTVDADDAPVAYLLTAVLDNCAHIEQVSVAPSHARRGVGAGTDRASRDDRTHLMDAQR